MNSYFLVYFLIFEAWQIFFRAIYFIEHDSVVVWSLDPLSHSEKRLAKAAAIATTSNIMRIFFLYHKTVFWIYKELYTIYFKFYFQPLQLSGHSGIISATCFGQKDRPLLLCTASEDFIYIWNIEKLLAIDNISMIY